MRDAGANIVKRGLCFAVIALCASSLVAAQDAAPCRVDVIDGRTEKLDEVAYKIRLIVGVKCEAPRLIAFPSEGMTVTSVEVGAAHGGKTVWQTVLKSGLIFVEPDGIPACASAPTLEIGRTRVDIVLDRRRMAFVSPDDRVKLVFEAACRHRDGPRGTFVTKFYSQPLNAGILILSP